MIVVCVEDYTYLVPFVENDEEIFLKTIIPSSKATKKYFGTKSKLDQFTGAYVKTETNYSSESNATSESYFVVLQQQGMFLTGVTEQTLREEAPIFNTHAREASIANAISGFLSSKT